MKFIKILLIAALGAASTLSADVSKDQLLIVLSGYRCDTVSRVYVSRWDNSKTISCNNYQYTYEIKDVGGNITITVK